MKALKTPYAFDARTRDVTKACNASKSTKYICLECGVSLSIRDGGTNQKHFAHPPTGHEGCQGESLIHKAAKAMLVRQIRRELENTGQFLFQQYCPGPEGRTCQRKSLITDIRTFDSWTKVAEEVNFNDFRLDVAILDDVKVVYGFEVFHKHKVPEHKAESLGIRWMELAAEDILAFKPRVPYGYPEAKRKLCQDCTELQQYLQKREPDDRKREKLTEEYLLSSKKLNATWRNILQDAEKMDRESRKS